MESTSTSTSLTLMVLVDALRPDYLAHMPYLSGLAGQGATGVLRECFGFVPRAAYFGGLSADQYGYTNMYRFRPEDSPFSMARGMPTSGTAELERQVGLRQAVEESARERLPPFAKDYAYAAEIPMAYLPYFDLVEKRAPWDPQVGFRSLFHELDERGVPWLECSWPGSNRLANSSDDGIVLHVLAQLRPEHRFCYVHLQELDAQGHVHGPQSRQLQARQAATDRRCRQLIESVRTRYDQLHVVLFGDHGMVNVTRVLDVQTVIQSLGLRYGVDYAYFLDSSMARFWFYHARARRMVQEALGGLTGGRVLSPCDLESLGIKGCDPSNAELIFLADPGVLVFPNFFQSEGEPVKGMHGYHPDCPDNLGLFLLQSSHSPVAGGGELGVVDPPDLYPMLRRLIGMPDAGPCRPLERVPKPARPAAGRYTAHPNPEADAVVHAHLHRILQAIHDRLGPVEAVVLTGSFGRGEGGVFQQDDRSYHPVNDYDLIVISPENQAVALKELGDALAAELGLDFVDLAWSDGRWDALPPTVSSYDLKYGSCVLAGDPAFLERLPPFAAADLSLYEGVKLMLNRSAGILSGLTGRVLEGVPLTKEEQRYLTNQIAKAWMSIGDTYLIRWQGFDTSYRRRSERFQSLAPGVGIDASVIENVTRAYGHKCQPSYGNFARGRKDIEELYGTLENTLLVTVNMMTQGAVPTLVRVMQAYLDYQSGEESVCRAENQHCQDHPVMRDMLAKEPDPAVSLRHLIYSVLPLILTALGRPAGGEEGFLEARRVLSPHLRLTASDTYSPESWEALRAQVVQAWFAVCH